MGSALKKFKVPLALTIAGSGLGAAYGYHRAVKTAEYDPTKTRQDPGWDDHLMQGRKQQQTTSNKITDQSIRQIADEWLMREPPAGVRKFGYTGHILKSGALSKIL